MDKTSRHAGYRGGAYEGKKDCFRHSFFVRFVVGVAERQLW